MAVRTRKREQNQPIDHQHRPEDWQIEYFEPTADETQENRSGGTVPKLKFRQPPHKRSKFLVLLRRKTRLTIL